MSLKVHTVNKLGYQAVLSCACTVNKLGDQAMLSGAVSLQAKPNCRVLIVNHENITNCRYAGNDPHMMVVNCLFRIGGAAALLSNKYVCLAI